MAEKMAKLERLEENKIVITFPEGTAARLRTEVPVDLLMKVLSAEPEGTDNLMGYPLGDLDECPQ